MTQMITRSGKVIDLTNMDPSQVDIRDIAWALSRIGRWNCHTIGGRVYTVAQHTIRVVELTPIEYAVHAFLHDAAEAYVGDVSHGMKMCIRGWHTIEDSIKITIYRSFGLPLPSAAATDAVKTADNTALAQERRYLMPRPEHPTWDSATMTPLMETATPIATGQVWPSSEAYRRFMAEAQRLLPSRLFTRE